MDARLDRLLESQDDLVAGWQLRDRGWKRRKIDHFVWVNRWRVIHAGVYAANRAPLTRRQLWRAAVLTAPRT